MYFPRDLHYQFNREPLAGGVISSVVYVGTDSQIYVRANRNRKKIIFFNMDAYNNIYLAKGELATLFAGIPLVPGAWYEDIPDSLGYIYVGQFSAIGFPGAVTMSILEEF